MCIKNTYYCYYIPSNICNLSYFAVFILFFPILFLLGWMPQADTFSIYFLEQVDMHVFGGTASTGLVCSLYSILRSVFSSIVLWALGYAAFRYLDVSVQSSRSLLPL